MQKTRLGISVGLFGAAIYFVGLFSGLLSAILLAGYVLIFEENEWLKRNVVKAITLMILFSICTTVVNLIPNGINFINNLLAIFGGSFSVNFLSRFAIAFVSLIDIFEKVLFMILGLKALNQGTIIIPIVDRMLNEHREFSKH